jgi:curli production assembly/transport component CsgG
MSSLTLKTKRTTHLRSTALAACLAAALGACSANHIPKFKQAELPPATVTQNQLASLPAPREKIAVAVYGFTDQTGQFKPNETGQTLSRAVTQGATSILVKALQDAGNRSWFTVVERERLENLLKERQIIREMRLRYLGEKDINPQALPPLLFAGVLLEGGIIGYDTNTLTGGAGARFLGIGATTEYRQDTVTVYLRAISTKTGEVLSSVVTRKSIASIGVSANTFRYVAFKELLEAEAGFTTNEPDQLALQQAVEKAVHALIMEGAQLGFWQFADRAKGQALLDMYRGEKSGKSVPVTLAAKDKPTQKPDARAMAADAPVKRTLYPAGKELAGKDLPGRDLKTDNATLAAVTTAVPSDAATDMPAMPTASVSDAKASVEVVAQTAVPAVNPAAAPAPNLVTGSGASSAVTGVQGIVVLPGGGAIDSNLVGDHHLQMPFLSGPMD